MASLWEIVHMACVLMMPIMVPLALYLAIRIWRRRSQAKKAVITRVE